MRRTTPSRRPPARAITWPPPSWRWPASWPRCCCATSAQPTPPRPFTAPRSRRRAGFMAEVRRVVLIAFFALLIAAPAAQAGTAAVSGSTLTVRGGGVANDLAVDRGGGLVRVHDGAGGLNPGNGCLRLTGFDVTCADGSVNAIVVFGEGGGDRIRLNTPGRVSAGEGGDTVTGSGGGDVLTGGGGNDNLAGGPGPDRINGDAGNDTVDGGSEDDILRGGDGDDSVLGA